MILLSRINDTTLITSICAREVSRKVSFILSNAEVVMERNIASFFYHIFARTERKQWYANIFMQYSDRNIFLFSLSLAKDQ